MQWEAGPNAGFTASGATPWLPVLPGKDSLNVAAQLDDAGSLLRVNQSLLRLRAQEPALKWGSLKWLEEYSRGDVLAYQRIYRDQSVAVLINFSDGPRELPLPGNKTLVFASGDASIGGGTLRLGPNSGVLIR